MEYKSLMLTLKEDGPEGSFLARIATLNEIDKDGDVTLAGAFPPAKEVLVSSYMHTSWAGALPVGKAVIREIGNEVIAEGQFNMDSETGREHYAAVKFSGNLQEWSYGFKVTLAELGTFQGQSVRFLKGVNPFEISPVLVGAGNGTATLAIKALPNDLPEEDVQPLTDLEDTLKGLSSFTAEDIAELDNEDLDGLIECIDIFLEPEKGGPGSGPRPGGRARRAGLRLLGHLRKRRQGLLSELRNLRTMKLSSPRSEGVRKDMIKGAQTFLAETRREMVAARRKSADGPAIKSAQTYADQGDRLLADLVEYAERTKELAALRAKDGRMISAANMDRLRAMMERVQSVMEEMAALMEDATPPAKGAMQVWAEYHRLKAKLRSS